MNAQALITILTAKQLAAAKANGFIYMDNLAQAKAVEALGFTLTQTMGTKQAKSRFLPFAVTRALSDILNAHGAAVTVVGIAGKYSDNNGAYEVATVSDAEGNEFKVSNMYDTGVCFRNMTKKEMLAYANK